MSEAKAAAAWDAVWEALEELRSELRALGNDLRREHAESDRPPK